MNEFEYGIKIQAIDSLKTLKAKNEMIRELFDQLPHIWHYSNYKGTESHKRVFKCIEKILLNYSIDRLPLRLQSKLKAYKNAIFKEFTLDTNKTYKEFIDIFEFTEIINFPESLNENQLKILNNTIKNNPINFKLHLRYSINYTYKSKLESLPFDSNLATIVEMIDYQSSLNYKSTVYIKVLEENKELVENFKNKTLDDYVTEVDRLTNLLKEEFNDKT